MAAADVAALAGPRYIGASPDPSEAE